MKQDILDALLDARARKQPVALVSDLESGAQSLVYDGAVDGTATGSLALSDEMVDAARQALVDDRSGRHGDVFIQVFNPPKRLIVVGAVHIAQPLVEIARTAGYAIVIVDPRGAFATRDRFPGVELSEDWPDDALNALAIDNRTAIVALTHDPKLDDPALQVALRSNAFYIGALGSRKTHAARVGRLAEAGLTDAEITRIHAPIGLAIGAKSPAEIAISIMAQITEVLHHG